MKKGLFTSLLVVLLCSISFAQWTNQGAWPDANTKGQLHGVAVDPDGKIWAGNFSPEKFLPAGGGPTDSVTANLIRVYNPDGTQASFSPVWRVVGNGINDTLKGSNVRGMRPDHNGNILVVFGNQKMYRIDYKTGAGMTLVALGLGTSPTSPAVSDDGKIFVGPVVNAGFPILEFDSNFNLVGQAVPPFTISGFSRSMECSADGNTIYFPSYSRGIIIVYQRPDELSAFDSVGTIMNGVDCESISFNKATGNLWVSGGSYNDLPDAPYTPGTWYEYNVASKTVLDSIKWTFTTPLSATERPRAIDFSPDGLSAYFGCFGGPGYPLVQKATRGPITNITVTFQLDMSVMVAEGTFDPATQSVTVRGSFQAAAGDPGGDWQGTFFTMTAGANHVYSVTATFPGSLSGSSYAFKFVKMPGDGWESTPDRPLTLTGSSMILPKVYFNNDDVINVTVKNTLVFTADINGILNVGAGGAFDPNQDSLQVMGLDWEGGTNVVGDRRMVNSNPFNPGEYVTTLSVQSTGPKTKWKFKAWPSNRFSNDGWELGEDRWYTYGPDGTTYTYESIVPNIFPLFAPLPTDVSVTFNVDVTGAVNKINGLPIPIDQLEYIGMRGGADFLGSWSSGCWCPADLATNNMYKLENKGNNIWSRTVVVPAGTNGGNFEYKFAAMYPNADTVNGGTTPLDNEGGFGQNHNLLLSGASAIIIKNHKFGDFTTGIERIDDLLPSTYILEQNYPNPFNPSTVIKYSLPEASFVTLRIYNLLGEEVSVLVSAEQSAGSYLATFDASQLSSGIYFYSLETKGFTATKKMLLMK